MAPNIPASLSAAFAGRLTISATELCKLLPMDRSTLFDHIAAGRIAYVRLGSGSQKPRKSFTLEAVAAFLEARTETQAPPESRLATRRGRAEPDQEPQGFRARYAARKAERERERQKAIGEGPGLLALRERLLEEERRSAGNKPAPTGPRTARKPRVAERQPAEAAIASHPTRKGNRSPPSEDREAWKWRLAEQRRRRVAERRSRANGLQGDAI